jgi:drug/metabolite transporter (DMT)-like permease
VLPIATALVAVTITHERPRPLFWIASGAGAALVIAFALRQGGGALAAGDLFLFASVTVAAVGYAFSGRLTSQMPGWEVISWVLVIALPLSIPAAALTLPADISHIALKPWLGLLYVALFSQWIGFFAWNAGLAIGGIARVSQIQLLQPFVTFALAAFFNDETITLQILLFARAAATRSRAASAGGILIDQLRMFGNQFGSSLFRADGAKQNPCRLQMIQLHAQLDDLAH